MSKLKKDKDFTSAATNYLRQSRLRHKVLKTFFLKLCTKPTVFPAKTPSDVDPCRQLVEKRLHTLSSSEVAIQPFNTIGPSPD